MMNGLKLANRLANASRVRCKYWSACDARDCNHYNIHMPSEYSCIHVNPTRYCRKARGFVYDIPANEINFDQDCDPNIAFKAKLNAEAKEYGE